jgi:Arc/MetJ-type ribon-helix-helix transcriptional regulator
MDITLNRADQELIEEKLRRGEFRSADEVISRALRVLVEQGQELEKEKAEMRALLDERWRQSTLPEKEWLDGEEVMADFESAIDEYEKKRRAG